MSYRLDVSGAKAETYRSWMVRANGTFTFPVSINGITNECNATTLPLTGCSGENWDSKIVFFIDDWFFR